MRLNRYRLKHLAEKNHGGARRALELLGDPDELISLILLGNNFINILITQLATLSVIDYTAKPASPLLPVA